MNESEDGVDQGSVIRDGDAGLPAIGSVIADLGSRDGQVRIRARKRLVATGEPAVGPLVAALANPKESVRCEAARVLGQISVDWTTHADWAILSALVADLGSKDGLVRVRHHIVHDLSLEDLEDVMFPVLTALDAVAPSVEVPFAARAALDKLKRGKGQHEGR